MNGSFVGALNAAEAWDCVTMALGVLMAVSYTHLTLPTKLEV